MTTVKDPILTAWERTCANNRDRAAIFDSQGKVARTVSRNRRPCPSICGRVGKDRARSGSCHPNREPSGLAIAVSGLLAKRIVVLPLEQTISDEQRQNAFRLCQVAGFATLSSRAENASPARTEESRRVVFKVTSSGSLDFARDDGLALLKLTSGTTAAARAIRFRSEQLLADCENICETMGLIDRDVNSGLFPFRIRMASAIY
jgi:hypothetical protein